MPEGSRDPWNIAIWTARLSILLKAADYQFARRSCSMDAPPEFLTLPPLISMVDHSELLGIDDFLLGTLKGVGITHIVNPCTPVSCLGYYRFVGARAALPMGDDGRQDLPRLYPTEDSRAMGRTNDDVE